jgi:hypothetical protein
MRLKPNLNEFFKMLLYISGHVKTLVSSPVMGLTAVVENSEWEIVAESSSLTSAHSQFPGN